ncbi:hypothetical protein N7530_008892 [Penicillium desertorum]|uniref:SSCRP protein n=1 Tax=Penicillium desertorum TaxID=1303715 RepID=A0A9W9WPX7_9EURO|nr:hypothetical protein N7530_008892 [Penicillium desertorum]
MRFSILVLLAWAHARASFGGTLEVIDYDHQCVIWSNDNHGCTGHSDSFGQLDSGDCSKLSKVINGTSQGYPARYLEACGTENGLPVAWIELDETGLVHFFNQHGYMAACTLNNGFQVGSWCSVSDSESSTKASSAIPKPTSTSSLAAPSCGCASA